MEPITNNNQPPQPTDVASQGVINGPGTSVVQFPDGIDEPAVLRFTQSKNKAFADWAGPQMERIADLHAIFRNRPTKGEKATLPIPVGSGIVESLNARLQPQLLNKPKIVDAVADFQETNNQDRELVEAFVNQKALEILRRPDNGKASIKGAIIESVLIWRNLWKQEPYKRLEAVMLPDPAWIPNPLDPTEQPPMVNAGEREVEEVRQYWCVEREPVAAMAWDPNCMTCLQDSEWVRKRSHMSYNQLLGWQSQGLIHGVERLRNIIPGGAKGDLKNDWEAMMKKAEGDAYWPVSYADEKCYAVEEWYARMTWQAGEEVKRGFFHFFVVEGKVVINFEPNPLRPERHPWGSCPFMIDPDSVLGLSALDQTKSLQVVINKFSGHQELLGERAAKPLILYDSSSGMTSRAAFLKPYGYQPVDNINGIKEMATDTGPMAVLQGYMNWLIGLDRETSGANEQLQGIEGADTATEFQGLMAAAGSRLSDIVDTLQQGWLEPVANECRLFYAQFGVDGQMFANQGIEGLAVPVTRQQLNKDYHFVSVSSQNEQSKAQDVERAMKAIELGLKLPPSPDGAVFNAQKAYREIMLPALGQKTGDDWFTQLPPMPMMPGMPGPMGPEAGLPEGAPMPGMEG